jgi:menaquinone-specific isochorismate synthase
MTVTPYRTNLFQEHKELYKLLAAGKRQSIAKYCPQIVSISQEIKRIDPLAVLQTIGKPGELQFYFERRNKNEAIAAIGAATSMKYEGSNRFQFAQQFIQSQLNQTIINGNLNLPFAGPHFFCNFTFFEDNLTAESPFSSSTIFLPRWQVSSSKNHCVLVANVEINPQINLESLLESLCTQLKIINLSGRRIVQLTAKPQNQFFQQETQNAEQFKLSVNSALKSIQTNQLRKIVLANAIDVVSNLPFNLVSSLDKLRKRYPDCYVFSTSNGKGQNFIGASPERLISIRDHKLETDALAGSAPRAITALEDAKFAQRLLSSEKERREHQFVLDFIVERLSELGLNPQMLPMPQLLQLSNIQHLWTPIKADINTNIYPLEIVEKLHPTPAVAGVPTKIAQEQILALETYDRSLYAAPLGWVDYQGNCEFIVGIRSALIETQKQSQSAANIYRARLYAGAGIVAGSDPNKELAEIQLKLQALLKALL